MAGIVKKMMPVSRSMSDKDFVDFDADISFAVEYTGSPIDHSNIPRAFPVDVNRIPTAKVAPSPTLLSDLSIPMVEPVVKRGFRDSERVRLSHNVVDSRFLDAPFEISKVKNGNGNVCYDGGFRDAPRVRLAPNVVDSRFLDDPLESSKVRNGNCDGCYDGGFEGNGELKGLVGQRYDGIESSGTFGFSDSQDHSHELSESSDMVETPVEGKAIEGFQDYVHSGEWNSVEPGSTTQGYSGEISCVDEEASDGEALECWRRKKKGGVTICDTDTAEVEGMEESVYGDEGFVLQRPVPEKPAKKGLCYHCHRGNRFTEKEACIVCDAKYCKRCILRVMGSMPEGRKCLTCIRFPIDESKRHMLGKSSRMLKGLLLESEVKQIMEAEVSCPANQLPADNVFVNDSPLSLEELMMLRSCSNPPRNLNPGKYWYDKVSGFWGKEGQKPCQIITPQLTVGDQIKREASSGNTNVLINGREITKAELWMLQLAGVQCAGSPCFWVDSDGTYQEEGMNRVKGKIWGRKRTKLLCTILSLPTPESPNPGGQLNPAVDQGFPEYLNHLAVCNILLVGNDHSGTSTVYKQVKRQYGNSFSEEERQNIKFMIQSNLYLYIGRLLEAREQFEEESLSGIRKRQSTDEPGPSADPNEIQSKSEYAIGPQLKNFSDWLINIMVSGNLDIVFPAATREYAPKVEELWKDKAIQATYSRRDELGLPGVASYFLEKAADIAKVDYEPSETDILYAEGLPSLNGFASMEFSFPRASHERYGIPDPDRHPDPVSRCQLIRVNAKGLGENCKWLEMFENVNIVTFCVALTEYDEYEVDNCGVLSNKMLESKRLFESIVTHPTLKETNFLLLFNKFDLLEEKLEQVPLKHCKWFQDFNPVFTNHNSNRRNTNTNAQRAFHHVAVKFKRLFKSLTGRKLYVCPVTARDANSVARALIYAGEIVRWEEEEKWSHSLHESSSESIDIAQSLHSVH